MGILLLPPNLNLEQPITVVCDNISHSHTVNWNTSSDGRPRTDQSEPFNKFTTKQLIRQWFCSILVAIVRCVNDGYKRSSRSTTFSQQSKILDCSIQSSFYYLLHQELFNALVLIEEYQSSRAKLLALYNGGDSDHILSHHYKEALARYHGEELQKLERAINRLRLNEQHPLRQALVWRQTLQAKLTEVQAIEWLANTYRNKYFNDQSNDDHKYNDDPFNDISEAFKSLHHTTQQLLGGINLEQDIIHSMIAYAIIAKLKAQDYYFLYVPHLAQPPIINNELAGHLHCGEIANLVDALAQNNEGKLSNALNGVLTLGAVENLSDQDIGQVLWAYAVDHRLNMALLLNNLTTYINKQESNHHCDLSNSSFIIRTAFNQSTSLLTTIQSTFQIYNDQFVGIIISTAVMQLVEGEIHRQAHTYQRQFSPFLYHQLSAQQNMDGLPNIELWQHLHESPHNFLTENIPAIPKTKNYTCLLQALWWLTCVQKEYAETTLPDEAKQLLDSTQQIFMHWLLSIERLSLQHVGSGWTDLFIQILPVLANNMDQAQKNKIQLLFQLYQARTADKESQLQTIDQALQQSLLNKLQNYNNDQLETMINNVQTLNPVNLLLLNVLKVVYQQRLNYDLNEEIKTCVEVLQAWDGKTMDSIVENLNNLNDWYFKIRKAGFEKDDDKAKAINQIIADRLWQAISQHLLQFIKLPNTTGAECIGLSSENQSILSILTNKQKEAIKPKLKQLLLSAKHDHQQPLEELLKKMPDNLAFNENDFSDSNEKQISIALNNLKRCSFTSNSSEQTHKNQLLNRLHLKKIDNKIKDSSQPLSNLLNDHNESLLAKLSPLFEENTEKEIIKNLINQHAARKEEIEQLNFSRLTRDQLSCGLSHLDDIKFNVGSDAWFFVSKLKSTFKIERVNR